MISNIAIIGLGLIGSSIIHALRETGHDYTIIGYDSADDICKRADAMHLIPEGQGHIARDVVEAVRDADLTILCVPVGACAAVTEIIAPNLKRNAILSDVGSVKEMVQKTVVSALQAHNRGDVTFIPAHPIAGTENSGPEAGFATLFQNRWCILTPEEGTSCEALKTLTDLWISLGSNVEIMSAGHHDKVLGITSHLPHLIAYTIVGTATDLEDDIKSEVIKFSASGFRDFTRIAASDPTMWRDIFVNNKEAVLDILQRFNEDLTGLQKAIRKGDAETLFDFFTKTRDIRRKVVDAKQDDVPQKPDE